MESLWRAATSLTEKQPRDYDGVEFWSSPERTGWLMKQGEYIKTWRRRWFVLKQGKLFWFKDSTVTRASVPRGVIPVASCLTVKGAEDALNKQYAFELSTRTETMYFIADSEKEKEDWINSIGRSIVQHSRSVTANEIVDYDSKRTRLSILLERKRTTDFETVFSINLESQRTRTYVYGSKENELLKSNSSTNSSDQQYCPQGIPTSAVIG